MKCPVCDEPLKIVTKPEFFGYSSDVSCEKCDSFFGMTMIHSNRPPKHRELGSRHKKIFFEKLIGRTIEKIGFNDEDNLEYIKLDDLTEIHITDIPHLHVFHGSEQTPNEAEG